MLDDSDIEEELKEDALDDTEAAELQNNGLIASEMSRIPALISLPIFTIPSPRIAAPSSAEDLDLLPIQDFCCLLFLSLSLSVKLDKIEGFKPSTAAYFLIIKSCLCFLSIDFFISSK